MDYNKPEKKDSIKFTSTFKSPYNETISISANSIENLADGRRKVWKLIYNEEMPKIK